MMNEQNNPNVAYNYAFFLLVVTGGILSAHCTRTRLHTHQRQKRVSIPSKSMDTTEKFANFEEIPLIDDVGAGDHQENELRAFKWNYLVVYAMVMMSDWLQGPYIYALYRSYGYGVREIAMLFIVGFSSSAIFGTLAGSIADKVGRKKMCLTFCLVYTLSCMTKFSPNFCILLLGRVTGGIATSLLFSVFEAWMVSEFHSRGFEGKQLSDVFSWATFLNGFVAIVSGVLANILVDINGKTPFGYASPFAFSIVFLMAAFIMIGMSWGENYGIEKNTKYGLSIMDTMRHIRNDTSIMAVGSMQCFFESSMYTFVFMWSPALEAIKEKHHVLPYGIIFASFMVAIMIGSIVFKGCVQRGITYESIARGVFLVAGISFGVCGVSHNEMLTFLAFNVFEVCCGVYFPTIGTLRSFLIPENTRATVMNVFRIPLNLIVVASLLKVDSLSQTTVFGLCAVLNILSFVFAGRLRTLRH